MTGTTVHRPPPPPPWPMRLTSPLRCLPDFLILGAQKAGTSSLFEHLNRHPAVWMPPRKECNFFSGPPRPTLLYRSYFMLRSKRRQMERELGRKLLLGEATPYYLFHPAVPERVERVLPQARFIVLLRDPVERAWSHFRHCVRLGLETESFEDAITAEPQRVGDAEGGHAHRHHTYVARGRYADQLRRWFDRFGRERFHVEIAEALFQDPGPVLRRIESFLGLPPGPEHPFEVHNRGMKMDPMGEATRRGLRAEFVEPNRDLAQLLDIELPWPD